MHLLCSSRRDVAWHAQQAKRRTEGDASELEDRTSRTQHLTQHPNSLTLTPQALHLESSQGWLLAVLNLQYKCFSHFDENEQLFVRLLA
jgi:hypothetical protein